MLKNISLHPKLAAFLDAAVNVFMLWRMSQIHSWWVLLILAAARVALWVLLIRLVYYPPEVSRVRHFFSLLIFYFGTLAMMIFIDWHYAWYLLGLFFVFLPLVSFWLLPAVEDKLFLVSKHHRRWLFLMNVFGVGGIWNGMCALIAFQVLNINHWFLILPVVAISTAAAIWWWREYGLAYTKQFWLWSAVLAAVMIQMSWVILLNPLGNFTQGLFLTWIWYILWIIIRFYLSPEGVDWRRQRWFLGGNLVLMILFLVFLARWN